LIAMLAHSVVDFNMHIPANALVAVALMALVTSQLRFATERFWFKLGGTGKAVLTGAGLALVIYLAQQTGVRTLEYVTLARASRATELRPRVDLLKAAYALEPKNFETTHELGETLRLSSWQGLGNYRQLATEAIPWFEVGTRLNRFDPYNYLRWGMCLHWLERTNEAGPYFAKALALDANNYYIEGLVGWHYFQLGDWEQSERWFKKAVYQANWHPDFYAKKYETGVFYLNLIEQKKREATAGAK